MNYYMRIYLILLFPNELSFRKHMSPIPASSIPESKIIKKKLKIKLTSNSNILLSKSTPTQWTK